VLPHSEFTVMFPEPHAKLCHVPTTDASSLHYRLNVNTSLTIPGVDAMQRVVDALHAGRRRPACSLHAGRIVRPELTCQFSAYNSIVLFLFLAAWRNSDTPTSVGLLTVIPAACRCFATSQQCLNLIVSVRQCKSINIWSHQAKNHIFLSTRDVLW